ncbi:multifunctional CCA addition/repair protein [Snodgrassella sp. CFCC 13594]|uniref:multifunctional CCA addition/repair protein n=1 Tax=Snodgrassella sp. CFCC 13594 TaxID=1775559 RepID=UPI00082AC5FE|nr:multifunctional CCA addition/repair protein [Snodgrassella sp. CFCC 13594]
MNVYLVGGAVRDRLLNRPISDRDWVVVGSSGEDMIQAGYRPVGKDFPVFLHPQTHEEYALARTERKVAAGYAGFSFDAHANVTLQEDLQRRDLTINAMAEDQQGNLIDPYGGHADLQAGVLRHVSLAFTEDPVRILRTARFAARFDFQIAPETMTLMRTMVDNGEVNALVPERVWQELSRGLMEAHPARMIETLRACGALAILLPEVDALFGVPQRAEYHPEIDAGIHTLMTLNYAAQHQYTLTERYAALLHDVGKAKTPTTLLPRHHGHDLAGIELVKAVNTRWHVPKHCAQLALLVCAYHIRIHAVSQLRPATVLTILHKTDAWRRPDRFASLLRVCIADARGRLHKEKTDYPQQDHWLNLLLAARNIDTAMLASTISDPQQLATSIDQARLSSITPLQNAYRQHHSETH